MERGYYIIATEETYEVIKNYLRINYGLKWIDEDDETLYPWAYSHRHMVFNIGDSEVRLKYGDDMTYLLQPSKMVRIKKTVFDLNDFELYGGIFEANKFDLL